MPTPRALALVALLAAAPLAAQSPRVAAMEASARAIDSARIRADVTFLASDPNGGRSTLDAGYDSAAAFVAARLRALGIAPAGDSGGYFQHYTVISSRLDTARAGGQVAGGRALRYGEDFVVQSFLQPGRHAGPVVYVSHGIRAPGAGIDPYRGLEIRGAWLLVDGGTGLPPGTTREDLGRPGVDWFTVSDEVKRLGALGILTLPSEGMLRGWNSFRNRVPVGRDLTPAVGRAYAAYPLPRVTLSAGTAAALAAGTPLATALADTTAPSPSPFALDRELTIDLVAETTTYRPYNVVGLVEGSDPARAGEWISVASHLDGAVGRAVTPEGDSIYNAADDNASGSAVDLSVAEALMRGPRPARSVLLIWDSGEEIGLWGSRHLAYNASERIVAHFNNDMLGRTRAPGTEIEAEADLAGPMEVWVSGPSVLSTVMERALERVRREHDWVTLTPKHDAPGVSFFYPRTDAAPFMEMGIPVIQFFTGLHADYHRQGDESTKLDIPKMTGAARMIYAILWHLAEDPERPRWDRPVPAELPFVVPKR
ncbi:MAG TPA: M28 family peptidase [Gemmatimonadales bacterium]|nr:M28 family peptidase [Gemmatimonadales bacterium]